jgi:NADH-quinone oxidoreductase subunit G
VTLATWKLLLDDGRMLDGDDYLKATARTPVALVSPTTLDALGLVAGARVTVTGDHGSSTLPLGVADLPDGVVWTPTTSGSAPAGSVVRLTAANQVEGAHA